MARRTRDELPEDDYERPSKSDAKREMDRLQEIGGALAALSENRIRKLPASEGFRDALLTLKTLRSHEAVRRQKQYIGKLMRHEDTDGLLAAIDARQGQSERKLQLWRQRLISQGDDAVQDFVKLFHAADHHTLRQLVRNAMTESAAEADASEIPGVGPHVRRLQRYLNEIFFLQAGSN